MKVLFFKAKKGRWDDKLIAFWTRSEYSHCEIEHNGYRYGSNPAKKGKIMKWARSEPSKKYWEMVDIDLDPKKLEEFINKTNGAKYDWLGIFLSQFLPFKIHSKKRYFCSEWIAEALGYKKPHTYSPQKLYKSLIRITNDNANNR